MFCENCGTQLQDHAAFCPKCGTRVIREELVTKEKKPDSVQMKLPKQKAVLLLLGAFVIMAGIVGGVLLMRSRSEEREVMLADGTVMEEENWQELQPLYDAVEVPAIEIYAGNYTPGTKTPGILWDKTLFYWLEDVDQTSREDGYLAKCPVGRMLLRNAEDGSLIEYEVYRDPETEEIYKIVSIEQGTEELRLTDYYYQNGNPNFTFSRNDSVYTPTYATPAKTGERYYFNGDVMARWRMIEEPHVIEEYVLTLNDAAYSQYDYFGEGAEDQKNYDETEVRELNAARNTFDAVTNAGAGIGVVEGRVSDAGGNPLQGMTVDILREADDALLYRSATAEDGSFNIFVHLEDVSCRVVVRGNDTYASNSIQGVELSGATGGSSCGEVRLHRLGGDACPVQINVYDAAKVRTGEDGSLSREALPEAEVSLRAGAGVQEGEAVQVLEADADGAVHTRLPAGTYTAQIEVPGYASAYMTVEVAEQESMVEGYLLPEPEENQTGVVLSWEGEADLDLTLFTPYQSTDGDMAHIGGNTTEDGHGNRLVSDNAAGCEVMYVNTDELGNYKLYVNNYTESMAENYSSGQLSELDIHVCLYDSTGLIGEFSFPAGQNGVVWEVADINGSRITPGQRVYSSLEGKSWWTESKWTLDMEENVHLKHLMESMVLAAWGNNDYNGYGYSSNTVNGMQTWADELYRGNWENMGDWLGTVALTYYIYPKTYYGDKDRADMPYIDEIMTRPDVAEILQDQYQANEGGWLLTKDQLEYLAYAASGIEWHLQSIDDVVNAWPICGGEGETRQIDDRILFSEGAAGLMEWMNLENITSKYIEAGKWSVSADCIYSSDYYGFAFDLQMAEVTFTVTRNPDSCFDGYSITSMNITPTDNSDWAQAYYDYLAGVKIKDIVSSLGLESEDFGIDSYYDIQFCYIDGDNIPEIYVVVDRSWVKLLYSYNNGQVELLTVNPAIRGGIDWIEKENRIRIFEGGLYESVCIAEIVDGELQQIADGHLSLSVGQNDRVEEAVWNNIAVTEEEYYALRNEAFDETKADDHPTMANASEAFYLLQEIIDAAP